MNSDGSIIDWSQMHALRNGALWDAITSMPAQFMTAAESNPRMWVVLVMVVIVLTRKGWFKLTHFVSGAYTQQRLDV